MNSFYTLLDKIFFDGEAHAEQIVTGFVTFYAFVTAHGGIIPMWDKFMGFQPKQQETQDDTNEKPKIVGNRSGTGNGPTG